MFKEKLENLRNKFTERANTLFTSMKDGEEDKDYKIDKKEKIKEKIRGLGKTKEDDEIEGELSPLVDDRTKKKYDISTEDKKEIRTKVLDNEKESRRADLLYPTMKNKEEKEEKTEKNLDKIDIQKKEESKQKNEQENLVEKEEKQNKIDSLDSGNKVDKKSIEKRNEIIKDSDFNNFLKYLYPREGGYSDRKADLGGKTNLGVTQSTFDWYNKKNNIPIKDVKNITKDEATKIYYDYFWKESGASSIKYKKLALMYFDAAINHGPYYAKKYYKESKGNFDDFMELRKKHYKRMAENIPRQKENYNGWINRLNHLKKFSEEL